MIKRDHFDVLSGLVILGFGAYLGLEASKIDAPANVYPLVILTIVIILAFISTLSAMRRIVQSRTTPAPVDAVTEGTTESLKIWGIVLALIGYAFGMQFDYKIATCAFLFVMFLSLGAGKLSIARAFKALLMAVALTAFLHVAFVLWLNVSVPDIFM